MAEVTLEEVSKSYGGRGEEVVALKEMDLDIPDGEFVVFVGPSGCGKSTALRMIAGLEDISSGQVFIGDRVVNELPPRERDIAMVFQNYALYPHMNVRENLGFALKLRKTNKQEIARRVNEAARVLGIKGLLDRKPKALSGGQRQRVALGRAIVREPKAFLMDEPLSNLDAKLRVQMRTEITKLHDRIGTTTIYVTHDQTEAMTMADRIVVLKDGVVQQIATPQRMYDHPKNVFVAGFIGSPAMNFIRARLEKSDSAAGLSVLFGEEQSATRIPLTREVLEEARESGKDLSAYINREVILGVRPEHLEDASVQGTHGYAGSPEPTMMEVEPQVVESLGSEKYVYFSLSRKATANPYSVEEMNDAGLAEQTGAIEGSSGEGSAEEMMVARVSVGSAARRGERMKLTIDGSRVRLFDPESETALL